MRHVRLALDAGGREAEIHPVYDVMANAACVERAETIHVNFSGDELGLMHHVEGDAAAYEAALDEIDEVLAFELAPSGESSFYAYHRCAPGDARPLFEVLTSGRLIHVPPTVYRSDGTVAISLIGTAAAVQTAVDAMPDVLEVTIEEVTGVARATGAARSLLSDRQREAVEAALELGYYEIPREATSEDVAAAIDCAPSTAAEHLRKAESKLLSASLGDG